MSWIVEVTERGTKPVRNGMRFRTREDAESYASDLRGRWLGDFTTGIVEVSESHNYWIDSDGRTLPCDCVADPS